MSLLIESPIISLNPVSTIIDPVVMLPVASQILMDPATIYYDPFRTFNMYMPGSLAYYVNYPDLNTDVNMQRKVLNKIWNNLENKWIFDFIKVFKYVTGSVGSYKLVSSFSEAENNKLHSENMEEKAEWILKHFYTKSNLISTIEKFRNKANLDWWSVDNDQDRLKQFIYHQMKRKLLEKLS